MVEKESGDGREEERAIAQIPNQCIPGTYDSFTTFTSREGIQVSMTSWCSCTGNGHCLRCPCIKSLVEYLTAASIPAQPLLQQSTQIQRGKLPPQPCHTLMPFLQLLTHPKHRCHEITKQHPKAKCGHRRSTGNVHASEMPSHWALSKSTFTWSSLCSFNQFLHL